MLSTLMRCWASEPDNLAPHACQLKTELLSRRLESVRRMATWQPISLLSALSCFFFALPQ